MADFKKLILTNEGKSLIAKAVAGISSIEFTKILTSSAQYEEKEIADLTEMSDIKQTMSISSVKKINKSDVQINCASDNKKVTTGYYLNTFGLFAKGQDAEEILYAVASAEVGSYVPAYNNRTVSGIALKVTTTVTNAENVTVSVNPAAVATIGDLQDLQRDFEAFKNTPAATKLGLVKTGGDITVNKDGTMDVTALDHIQIGGRNYFSNNSDLWEQGNLNVDTGSNIPNTDTRRIRTKDYIPFAAKQYIINALDTHSEDYRVAIFYYDSAKTYLSADYWISTYPNKMVAPANTAYCKFLLSRMDGITNISPAEVYDLRIKIEKGDVVTDWTPAPEDLKVGGRNLLTNSKGVFKPFQDTNIDNFEYYPNSNIFLEKGKVYVLSGKTNGKFTHSHLPSVESDNCVIFMTKQDKSTHTIVSDVNTGTKGTYFTWSGDTGNYILRVNVYHPGATNTIQAWELKIESGNVKTDWTPAPEDIVTKVNNLQIGGRNLLKNTAFQNDTLGWNKIGNHSATISTVNKYNAINSLSLEATGAGSGAAGYISKNITTATLIDGDVLTVSFYAKADSPVRLHVEMHGSKLQGNFDLDSTWKKFSVKLERAQESRIYMWLHSAGTAYINSIKLETGTVPTDWTPAPEDLLLKNEFEIGSKNLLKNSDFYRNFAYWALESPVVGTIKNDAELGKFLSFSTPTFGAPGTLYRIYQDSDGFSDKFLFTANKNYIISFNAKASANTTIRVGSFADGNVPIDVQISETWKRYNIKYRPSVNGFAFSIGLTAPNIVVDVTKIMITQGTKEYTDYTPSIEELQKIVLTASKKITTDAGTYYYGKANGSEGTSDSVLVATFDILEPYIDYPIDVVLYRRSTSTKCNCSVLFSNRSDLKGVLASFVSDVPNIFYLDKAEDSKWNLYVKKTQSYNTFNGVEIFVPTTVGIQVTIQNKYVETLPTTAVNTTCMSKDINITGNAAGADGKFVTNAGVHYYGKINANDGTNGYYVAATLKILSAYVQYPITFTLHRKASSLKYEGTILFRGVNNTDPDIAAFNTNCGNDKIFLAKTATGTWNIYIKKAEAYDIQGLDIFVPTITSVSVTTRSDFVSELPSNTVSASIMKPNIDISGKADWASRLAVPRKITLSGAVTGSGSFDGSNDLSITTTGAQIHYGTSEPANSLGNNGDIYVQY